jgi:hypothetical protein
MAKLTAEVTNALPVHLVLCRHAEGGAYHVANPDLEADDLRVMMCGLPEPPFSRTHLERGHWLSAPAVELDPDALPMCIQCKNKLVTYE